MTGYALHPEAYGDLDEVRSYIAAESPDAAGRVVTEIFDAIRRPGFVSPSRLPPARPHRPPDEEPLWVIAVLHGHRSPRTMAAILRARE